MILVFGKGGQVAKELQNFKNVKLLDRERADLRKPEVCVRAINQFKPIAVINAAAYTSVDEAEDNRDLVMTVNGFAPASMIKTCAELNIPFVHISSDYVFEGTGLRAWKPNDPTKPQNVYGESKLLAEKAILNSGGTFAILRTSWVISANGKNFVKTMLKLSKSRDRLKVISDQIGGPTPAKDIAFACLEVAKQLIHDPKKSGIYHFSGTPDTSWYSLAKSIFDLAGLKTVVVCPILTSEYPTKAKRPLNSRLDCSLIEETFNLSRPFWQDGLKDIISELENSSEKA